MKKVINFGQSKLLLIIGVSFVSIFFLYFIFSYFFFSDNYAFSSLRFQLFNQFVPNYLKASDTWKSYSLTNITFQAPDNFYVEITDKYQARIQAIEKLQPESYKLEARVRIDSGIYRHVRSYQDAINYYRNNKEIRVLKFEELNDNTVKIIGQKQEFQAPRGETWIDFDHILVNINDRAVLVASEATSPTALINPKTIVQIVESIKPLNK